MSRTLILSGQVLDLYSVRTGSNEREHLSSEDPSARPSDTDFASTVETEEENVRQRIVEPEHTAGTGMCWFLLTPSNSH